MPSPRARRAGPGRIQKHRAMSRIPAQRQLITIEGATHLFEELGALDEVARYAADWFKRYLGTQCPSDVSP